MEGKGGGEGLGPDWLAWIGAIPLFAFGFRIAEFDIFCLVAGSLSKAVRLTTLELFGGELGRGVGSGGSGLLASTLCGYCCGVEAFAKLFSAGTVEL